MPNVSGKVYCSRECRLAAYLVHLTCLACGAAFTRHRYEVAKANRQGQTATLCSHACYGEWAAMNTGACCRGCGVAIPRAHGRYYCSAPCRLKGRRANRPWSDKMVAKACPTCQSTFQPKNSRHVHCSRPCADKAHAARMRGRGNSRYKHGRSRAKQFRRMRPMILERDGSCVACGLAEQMVSYVCRGKPCQRSNLTVHHLDEDPANNHPHNLITLCQPCHMVHHKSATTPFPWFAGYAVEATRSMTSKWRATATFLQTIY